MDVNDYVLAALTNERLRELRAQASVAALCSERGASRPLRVVVGELLVRLGQRVAGLTPARAAA
jgi:hypothetical protein